MHDSISGTDQSCCLATVISASANHLQVIHNHHHHHHHHHVRVAGEGRRVVAPPCPRSTARLQSSPVGRVESFRSWSSQLFRGRPGGRRHVQSGGRLSDTLMWSRRAMFAVCHPRPSHDIILHVNVHALHWRRRFV